MQLSDTIKDLYRRLIAISKSEADIDEASDKISVDDAISKLAVFYEKLRNTIDFQEEHLLRRFAIERDIKRRIVLESLTPKIAQAMIEGLIRSGYIQNKKLPDTLISDVGTIVNKYSYFIELVSEELKEYPEKRKIINWIASVMACEIDLALVSESRVDALVESLFSTVKDRINFKGETLSSRERNIQIYITLHKELVKSDNPIISYHLLNLYFPDWKNAEKELVEFAASKITSIYHGIQNHLNNPIRRKLAQSLKKQIVAYKVLKELIFNHRDNLADLFSNPEYFESEARKVLDRFSKLMRKKLRRSSVRAIIYIFITKIALAFVLEYPYDVYVMGEVNYVALVINIIFPPTLMFLVTLSARLPSADNTKMILDELRGIVYGKTEEEIVCELKIRRLQGPVYFFFEYLFYILLYGFIFGFIIFILKSIHFNLMSGGIFIFFVTAVAFFGTRIRQMTKEYSVIQKREGLRHLAIIFFTLPIIRAGHWFSYNLRRINLFTFILDFLIEAPFKLLVELMESWFSFLKDKKEDTYKT